MVACPLCRFSCPQCRFFGVLRADEKLTEHSRSLIGRLARVCSRSERHPSHRRHLLSDAQLERDVTNSEDAPT